MRTVSNFLARYFHAEHYKVSFVICHSDKYQLQEEKRDVKVHIVVAKTTRATEPYQLPKREESTRMDTACKGVGALNSLLGLEQ